MNPLDHGLRNAQCVEYIGYPSARGPGLGVPVGPGPAVARALGYLISATSADVYVCEDGVGSSTARHTAVNQIKHRN